MVGWDDTCGSAGWLCQAALACERSAATDRALTLEETHAHLLAILEVFHLELEAGQSHCGEGWVWLGDNDKPAGGARPSP